MLEYNIHVQAQAYENITFPLSVILEKLLTQENRVLEYWTNKKKRLDQNQQ